MNFIEQAIVCGSGQWYGYATIFWRFSRRLQSRIESKAQYKKFLGLDQVEFSNTKWNSIKFFPEELLIITTDLLEAKCEGRIGKIADGLPTVFGNKPKLKRISFWFPQWERNKVDSSRWQDHPKIEIDFHLPAVGKQPYRDLAQIEITPRGRVDGMYVKSRWNVGLRVSNETVLFYHTNPETSKSF
ncbi:MAG TPA: hypothetical protein VG621_00325 [Candidatus Paceibacterota bacterium]|nr:hypothetical protein [Candidatus Paceibacterota bacterium]